MAMSGAAETAALAFGPLISGTITNYSTWRVSFYILIPMGVTIIVAVFFSAGHLRRPENAHLGSKEKLKRLDLVGFALSVPMTFCVVLGLQWAGTGYSWSNWRIILLLVLAVALLVAFLAVEYRAGDNSMVPFKMLRQRSVAFASIITFCNFAALALIAYYVSRISISC